MKNNEFVLSDKGADWNPSQHQSKYDTQEHPFEEINKEAIENILTKM